MRKEGSSVKEVTGDVEGEGGEKGKRWGICIRQVVIQVETRIKKILKIKFIKFIKI